MFCKYCGKEIDDNATFCKYCGKSQTAADSTGSSGPAAAETPKTETVRSNPQKRNRTILISVIVVAIVVFFIIFGVVRSSSRGSFSPVEEHQTLTDIDVNLVIEEYENALISADLQNVGVSTDEFKKILNKEFGRRNYEEYTQEEAPAFHAELIQCASDGKAALYMLTYDEEIDTMSESDSSVDLLNWVYSDYNPYGLDNAGGCRLTRMLANYDGSFYYFKLSGTIFGDKTYCIRRIGNSMIIAEYISQSGSDYDAYDMMCQIDADFDGVFRMDEVDINALYSGLEFYGQYFITG